MTYGIRLSDTSGNTFTMTPDAMTIVSAGSVSMPANLNGDNTYGADIDLPASNIPVANIGVLVSPRVSAGSGSVVYTRYIDGSTLYYTTFYASSVATFYTRNDATGIMTSFSAGNRTANTKSTWDPILATYPIAFWDKLGATTFTKIRLFATSAFLIRDSSNDTNFSLAGTPSGNYNIGGPESYINDDNENTFAGADAYVEWNEQHDTQRDFLSVLQVAFASAKTVTKVEVREGMYAEIIDAGSASGNFHVYLYYASAWHDLITASWSNYTPVTWQTYAVYGRWSSVTAIKVENYAFAQKGSGYSAARAQGVCCELRAYGPTNSDDDENKIVYTIGSAGISTVDYLIAVKRYNY